MARPSIYDENQALEVCRRLADGETLRQICKSKDMPSEAAVRLWAVEDRNGFAAMYARSRNIGLDCICDGIIEIADDTKDDPNSRRVRIDSRKWFLSKLRPDKYGDAIKVEHSGQVDIADQIRKNRASREE